VADSGTLTASREGPNVKLTMSFPDGYDHSFMVERFAGTDDNGDEMWTPIHTGTNKFVQGDVDWEMGNPPQTLDGDWTPVPSLRTYRALAYRNAEPDSRVLILHTEGNYTDSVTV
jgi:hypothetical protein